MKTTNEKIKEIYKELKQQANNNYCIIYIALSDKGMKKHNTSDWCFYENVIGTITLKKLDALLSPFFNKYNYDDFDYIALRTFKGKDVGIYSFN